MDIVRSRRWRGSWAAALVLGAPAACSSTDGRTGVAYLHVTDNAGPCNIPKDASGAPQFPDTIDYRHVRATASFEAASQWAGGNLIVVAWRDADGSITRFYLDVSPSRGFGTSVAPNDTLSQALGLVSWSGSTRTFTGDQVVATIQYGGAANSSNPEPPGELLTLAAFDGKGANGEPLCKIVGVHATPSHERTDPYDPKWFGPNPSALIVDGPTKSTPTFAGDGPPSNQPVDPAAASPDPGGEAPPLTIGSFVVFGEGSAPVCD
jgi:hypothetical protein